MDSDIESKKMAFQLSPSDNHTLLTNGYSFRAVANCPLRTRSADILHALCKPCLGTTCPVNSPRSTNECHFGRIVFPRDSISIPRSHYFVGDSR
jgi:hypothetical protein